MNTTNTAKWSKEELIAQLDFAIEIADELLGQLDLLGNARETAASELCTA